MTENNKPTNAEALGEAIAIIKQQKKRITELELDSGQTQEQATHVAELEQQVIDDVSVLRAHVARIETVEAELVEAVADRDHECEMNVEAQSRLADVTDLADYISQPDTYGDESVGRMFRAVATRAVESE